MGVDQHAQLYQIILCLAVSSSTVSDDDDRYRNRYYGMGMYSFSRATIM